MAEAQKKPFDFILLMTVIIMLAFGIIMVLSASSPYAAHYKDDSLYYLKSQLRAVGIGLVFMLIFMNVNYKIYAKFSPLIMFGSLVLLIMVLIPGIGQEINGARRWMFGFQPSEFAKLAVILFFSYSLSKNKRQLNSFVGGFLPYLVLIGIYAALLMKEPHLSGTIIIGAIALIIMCCAGAKLSHYVMIVVPVTIIGIIAVVIEPYRLNRIISFLDPWKYSRTIGWQIINSLYAIGSGGIFGRGLGKSMQKYLYIPEPHTDFIFSVMAEEVGLIGVVLVMALFAVFIWRGLTIAANAPNLFGSLIAVGVTSLVALQAIINVAVVTSSIPATGMPLPFFSYGGSSVMFLLIETGILLNISRYSKYKRL